MHPQGFHSPAFAVLATLLGMPAHAIDGDDPNWPCEQALVTEVSPAVVWDGPPLDGLEEYWGSDASISELVQRLTSRDADRAEDEPLIEAFAAAQPAAARDHRLTILFAGVLEVLNADRRKLNAGILRYSRDQQQRAEALDADLTDMVRLETEDADAARQRLAELTKRIELEQRIFDDREKSIPFLCTRPRVVEQRIGELARTISAQLQ